MDWQMRSHTGSLWMINCQHCIWLFIILACIPAGGINLTVCFLWVILLVCQYPGSITSCVHDQSKTGSPISDWDTATLFTALKALQSTRKTRIDTRNERQKKFCMLEYSYFQTVQKFDRDTSLLRRTYSAMDKMQHPRIGAHGSVVVKALWYKPEGRGFDTRWGEF
jgi:hypothetical protein